MSLHKLFGYAILVVTLIALNYLTVGPWADVKDGFTWKIIIVSIVRGGHGE